VLVNIEEDYHEEDPESCPAICVHLASSPIVLLTIFAPSDLASSENVALPNNVAPTSFDVFRNAASKVHHHLRRSPKVTRGRAKREWSLIQRLL
jgi:hypothetical protein